jgi:hypothetical protein
VPQNSPNVQSVQSAGGGTYHDNPTYHVSLRPRPVPGRARSHLPQTHDLSPIDLSTKSATVGAGQGAHRILFSQNRGSVFQALPAYSDWDV